MTSGIAAELRMDAEAPPNADNFMRVAHHYAPTSLCLHDPKNQKRRANTSEKCSPHSAKRNAGSH